MRRNPLNVLYSFVMLLFITVSAIAQQERKVAVFDPAGEVGAHLKAIVREEISSIVVNTVGYSVLERQLIDRVLEENRFQTGGLVDDSQISEMGRMMGANFAIVANITELGNNFHISCKLIDVQTARIERQRTTQTQHGTNDFVSVIQTMVKAMFGQPFTPNVTSPPTDILAMKNPSTDETKLNLEFYGNGIREYFKWSIGIEVGGHVYQYTSNINTTVRQSGYDIGVLFTRNLSPYFGFDIAKLKVAQYKFVSNDSYSEMHSFQILTGIRVASGHYFGKKQATNFYSALRLGVGRNIYPNINSETVFTSELDFGLKIRQLLICPSITSIWTQILRSNSYYFGIKVGLDLGKKKITY